MSAREVGEATGTSDATVVRTAKSLGFESFRELRRAVSVVADVPIDQALRATIEVAGRPQDQLRSALDRQQQSLAAVSRSLSESQFATAVELMAGAPRIWWAGTGPSSHLAEYGAFFSRRLGRRSGAFTHAGTDHADELLSIEEGDVVVTLAYGRLHPHVRALLEHAAAVGASVVLVTDVVAVPEARAIRATLSAGRGMPGMFASHGVTVVLIEALVLAVAAESADRAERSVDKLNELRRSIAGRKLDVDPG